MRSSSARRLWLCLAFVGIGGCVVPHAQAASAAGIIGIVVDTHPQQRNAIEFERQVVDALNRVLVHVADEGFVVSYSDRVELVVDRSPLASGLENAAARLAVDPRSSGTEGAVLNDGLMKGLTKLGSIASPGRKGLIVIGEGNDGGSSAQFSQVLDAAKAQHIQCFALLVAQHRAQVGRVRQFGFDLFRLASGTRGKAYDIRTNAKALDEALQDIMKRLTMPMRS